MFSTFCLNGSQRWVTWVLALGHGGICGYNGGAQGQLGHKGSGGFVPWHLVLIAPMVALRRLVWPWVLAVEANLAIGYGGD